MKAGTLRSKKPTILDRLLDPLMQGLSTEATRTIAKFRADRATNAYIARLAKKCNEGELTDRERAEYKCFVDAADFIAILQAKARILLQSRKT